MYLMQTTNRRRPDAVYSLRHNGLLAADGGGLIYTPDNANPFFVQTDDGLVNPGNLRAVDASATEPPVIRVGPTVGVANTGIESRVIDTRGKVKCSRMSLYGCQPSGVASGDLNFVVRFGSASAGVLWQDSATGSTRRQVWRDAAGANWVAPAAFPGDDSLDVATFFIKGYQSGLIGPRDWHFWVWPHDGDENSVQGNGVAAISLNQTEFAHMWTVGDATTAPIGGRSDGTWFLNCSSGTALNEYVQFVEMEVSVWYEEV